MRSFPPLLNPHAASAQDRRLRFPSAVANRRYGRRFGAARRVTCALVVLRVAAPRSLNAISFPLTLL